MLAELLPHAIHRLVDPGEFLNFERILKKLQLPHGVFLETEEHDPRGAVFLVQVKELCKGRRDRAENVMGERRGPRELHLDPTHEELLGLQRDEGSARGELIFAGLDTGVLDILGELGKDKISIVRWGVNVFHFWIDW